MKKLSTLFMLLVAIVMGAQADTETFSMEKKWTSNSVTQNGITVTFSDVEGGVPQTGYFKFVKGQTMTISSTVGNITALAFTSNSEKYGKAKGTSVNTGTVTGAGTADISWTGDAAEVIFTNDASAGGDWRVASIVVTYSAGPAVAVDPVFSLTKSGINTAQKSQIVVGEKSGLDGLVMSDLTYDNAVINIDEAGVITPVAVGTSTITFNTAAVEGKYNAGSANLSISVSEAHFNEQANVTKSMTWDWSQFSTTNPTIQLTETTTPAKAAEFFVLSNVVAYGLAEDVADEFKTISARCEYPVRDGSYFQGPELKFNTTVPGKVKVTFCSTGSKENHNRDIVIAGNVAGQTTNTTMAESDEVTVAAGEVLIKGVTHGAGADAEAQYLRISKIEFTETEISTDKPTITQQPQNVSYTLGDTEYPNLSVAATASAGELKYQWSVKLPGAEEFTNVPAASVPSAAEATFKGSEGIAMISQLGNSSMVIQIKCIVSDDNGSVESNVATINIIDPNDAAPAAPTFDVADGATITAGDMITITAEDNATIYYRWSSKATATWESDAAFIDGRTAYTGTAQTTSSTIGDRYLYAQAFRGDKASERVMLHVVVTEATAVDAIAEAAKAENANVKVIKNGKLYIGNYNIAGQQVK